MCQRARSPVLSVLHGDILCICIFKCRNPRRWTFVCSSIYVYANLDSALKIKSQNNSIFQVYLVQLHFINKQKKDKPWYIWSKLLDEA